MKKFVENYIKEKELKGTDWNLLEHAEITEAKDSITLDWTDLKWYEGINGYEDVDAIMNSLDVLDEKDIDYQYMRIGEEKDDIDERWSVNKGSFNSFYVSRNFSG